MWYFSLDVKLVSVSSFSNNVEVRSSDIIWENYPHSPPCFSLCMNMYTCIAANAYTAFDLTHESQRLGLFQWEFRWYFSLDVELVSVSSFSNNDGVRSSDISRDNYPHSRHVFLRACICTRVLLQRPTPPLTWRMSLNGWDSSSENFGNILA